ncbi:hypothetical protein LCGC14_1287740 [marine sediment metagenome]|uniref:Uncharacterized protein n=1 Tax=marine sediment metagenome TaxID=412755 RepID=A0A0F9NWA4_9ZZZZ
MGARERIGIDSPNTASRFPTKAVETLGDNRTLLLGEVEAQQMFFFDPAGARDLTLPATADCVGVVLFISNEANAAEVITIKDAGGSTLCTPTQNEAAILFCNGALWSGGVVATS